MSVLWVEPFGGAAGDMWLAALLDLGDPRVDLEGLRALCAPWLAPGGRLEVRETARGGLRALHLDVRPPESPPLRHLPELVAALEGAALPERAAARARRVLERLAEAEARAHGVELSRVHFHEVGAVDTLVDVAGVAWALERLGVERVLATPPLVGDGTVVCAHGELPVPAPGTAELLRGMPTRRGGEGERTTPTGAALLAVLVDAFEPEPETFAAERIGYGAGTRDPRSGPPNLLRVQLGAPAATEARRAGEVWALAFNLDDATGEEVGFCVQALRAAGALEVWTHAVQMKKDRPGVVVTALARADLRADLERVAFATSPTLGVRWQRFERTECERETLRVPLEGEEVRVVVRRPPGRAPRPVDLSPEYDDLARLARRLGTPLRELEAAARELARGELAAREGRQGA